MKVMQGTSRIVAPAVAVSAMTLALVQVCGFYSDWAHSQEPPRHLQASASTATQSCLYGTPTSPYLVTDSAGRHASTLLHTKNFITAQWNKGQLHSVRIVR